MVFFCSPTFFRVLSTYLLQVCFLLILFSHIQLYYTGKDSKNNYQVWALLTHINHLRYPFCAKKCYIMPTAPPPCNTDPEQLNYRYVLINGDVSRWVDRTIDRMDQKKMPTTTCATTTKKGTTNAFYDFDMYEDVRQMVSNHKVCTAAGVHNTPVVRALSWLWGVIIAIAGGGRSSIGWPVV